MPVPNVIIETWVNDDCTIGRLTAGDFKCFTLELPWLFNQKNVSCIPAGSYFATRYKSPSKGDVILLINVENRDYIEIHAGNYTSQIQGCILVGDSIKYLNADGIPDVTNSRVTLENLLAGLPEVFTIKISRVSEESHSLL